MTINDYKDPAQIANPKILTKRYYPGDDGKKKKTGSRFKIQAWADAVWDTYVQYIDKYLKTARPYDEKNPDPFLDTPMKRCFAEVGWGYDLSQRAYSHEDHRASNELFTLIQAILVEEVDPQKNRFEIRRFMINRLPRDGTEAEVFDDANTSDVGGSLLNSSFWITCGYNPSPAAGGGVASRHIKDFGKWITEDHNRFHKSNSIFRTNLNKYEKMSQNLKDMVSRDVDDDRQAIEDENEKLEEKLNEHRHNIKTARVLIHLDRLRRRKDEILEMRRHEEIYSYLGEEAEEPDDMEESEMFNGVGMTTLAAAAVPLPGEEDEDNFDLELLTDETEPESSQVLVTPLRVIGHMSSSVAPGKDSSSDVAMSDV